MTELLVPLLTRRFQLLGGVLEQVIEIGLAEAAGEALLAEHVLRELRLALLQAPDFFLDRALGDKAIGDDGAILPDAVRAVDRLRLDGGVPPWIVEHHVARGGEIEAGARRLER